MQKAAIILAGGEGRRAGGDVPKQFKMLCGHPVVWWSMKAFHTEDPETDIILVLHPGFFDDWDIMVDEMSESDRIPCRICCGGKDRIHSVSNGLTALIEIMEEKGLTPCDVLVAVHDGARPLVSPEMIRRAWEATTEGVCGVPAIAPVNSLRRLLESGRPLSETESVSVSRSDYVEVQTPQTFVAVDAIRCYRHRNPEGVYTDDASLAEDDGMSVVLYRGEEHNIKITNPLDHEIAGTILENKVDETGR
ncbi:MAG: 2-C-methyl-D-erythritol 4-phosphate cytidylyltransferase [Muribaculaceae bacterium]|nr:2-C-methyl-D-erythritol 4-phosphate cytidylyltransferase [Muribaculaceae bacterium]